MVTLPLILGALRDVLELRLCPQLTKRAEGHRQMMRLFLTYLLCVLHG
jgi:hypothetical protein